MTSELELRYKKWRALKHARAMYFFLMATGAIESWLDGDVIAMQWRWYNPLSWIFAPGAFFVAFIIDPKHLYDYGFGLSAHWKKHKDKRQFFEIKDLKLVFVPKTTLMAQAKREKLNARNN